MAPTIKLAEYLFTRLRQLGIESIHGVPGDFNLELLDFVEPANLHWVGSCNELNAGYAANGYSRINGLGAIITTFGVGELSAINAIAGAYAERAPIVHIVGTPARPVQDNRVHIHHTFNDGEFRRFALMHAPITVAQANLIDPRTSPAQIDAALEQCLIHSRPIYIEVPVDMVGIEVSASRLQSPIEIPPSIPSPLQAEALSLVLEQIQKSKRPMIFVDGETKSFDMIQEIHQFMEKTKWPTWTTPFGKGLVDETLPNFHGVYMGNDKPDQKSFIDACDLIMVFGPHFSTTNSFQKSAVPNPAVSVSFTATAIQIGDRKFNDILPKNFLSEILGSLQGAIDLAKYNPYPELETPQGLVNSLSSTPAPGLVTQKEFYLRLSAFLRSGDVVLGETGTAGYGSRECALPPRTWYLGPVTWLSIGQMLPAAQGAALAQRELEARQTDENDKKKPGRTILLIGDGSLQMTVQELSTIIRENLNVIVFVLNNNGYTIERCIHGQNQKYNDVATWRYLEAPSFFGAKHCENGEVNTYTVRTWEDLARVIGDERLADGEGLRMIEVFFDQDDAPASLLNLLHAQLKRKNKV